MTLPIISTGLIYHNKTKQGKPRKHPIVIGQFSRVNGIVDVILASGISFTVEAHHVVGLFEKKS